MNKQKKIDALYEEDKMTSLRMEIAEAHQQWENANRFFHYALGNDQIDFAVHAIITAEKRYEMLLRSAKQMNVKWPSWRGVFE